VPIGNLLAGDHQHQSPKAVAILEVRESTTGKSEADAAEHALHRIFLVIGPFVFRRQTGPSHFQESQREVIPNPQRGAIVRTS